MPWPLRIWRRVTFSTLKEISYLSFMFINGVLGPDLLPQKSFSQVTTYPDAVTYPTFLPRYPLFHSMISAHTGRMSPPDPAHRRKTHSQGSIFPPRVSRASGSGRLRHPEPRPGNSTMELRDFTLFYFESYYSCAFPSPSPSFLLNRTERYSILELHFPATRSAVNKSQQVEHWRVLSFPKNASTVPNTKGSK